MLDTLSGAEDLARLFICSMNHISPSLAVAMDVDYPSRAYATRLPDNFSLALHHHHRFMR